MLSNLCHSGWLFSNVCMPWQKVTYSSPTEAAWSRPIEADHESNERDCCWGSYSGLCLLNVCVCCHTYGHHIGHMEGRHIFGKFSFKFQSWCVGSKDLPVSAATVATTQPTVTGTHRHSPIDLWLSTLWEVPCMATLKICKMLILQECTVSPPKVVGKMSFPFPLVGHVMSHRR